MPSISGSTLTSGITDNITAMCVLATGQIVLGTDTGNIWFMLSAAATTSTLIVTLPLGVQINQISAIFDPVYGQSYIGAAANSGKFWHGTVDASGTFTGTYGV